MSTDGCLGEAGKVFNVFGFIKARMSVAILRVSSQCLRGSRDDVSGYNGLSMSWNMARP